MFCMMCGKELKSGAKFCQYCGRKVTNPAGEEIKKQIQTKPVDKEHAVSGEKIFQTGNAGIQTAGTIAHQGQKVVHRAVNIKLLSIIAVALVAICVMLYVMFFQVGKPEDTIAKLEGALNDMNQTEVLECFDDQTQSLYSGTISVAGSLSGLPISGLADLANGLGGIMAGSGLTPQYKLNVTNVEYKSSDTCVVTVDFHISFQGQEQSETQDLPMKKDGRQWVISISSLNG